MTIEGASQRGARVRLGTVVLMWISLEKRPLRVLGLVRALTVKVGSMDLYS